MTAAAHTHEQECSCRRDPSEWYREYAPLLRKFTFKKTGDAETAEDCLHEAFLRAITHRHQFVCRGQGIRPWLFTIARNVAMDYRKSAVHRREYPTADLFERSDTMPTPEEWVTHLETFTDIVELINDLSSDQARCVRLRFLNQSSVAETASEMRRSKAAVKGLQSRAVRILRSHLADHVT